MTPVIKFLLYFSRHWRSCIWSQNPFNVLQQLLPGLGLPFLQWISGQVIGTQEWVPKKAEIRDMLLCSSCFHELRDLTISHVGQRYFLEKGSTVKIPWDFSTTNAFEVKQCQGQCNTITQVQQALRNEAKAMWPRDCRAKKSAWPCCFTSYHSRVCFHPGQIPHTFFSRNALLLIKDVAISGWTWLSSKSFPTQTIPWLRIRNWEVGCTSFALFWNSVSAAHI